MPICAATRRAAWTSSREQQRPDPVPPSTANSGSRRWFHNCMVMPTTVRPWRTSIAATVELSTPPLMATAMGNSGMHRNPAQMRHAGADGLDERVHLGGGIAAPEGEAHAGARAIVREADGLQDVGGREGSAGAGRAGGDGEAAQIERDDHGFAIDAIEVKVAGVGHAIQARAVDAGR